MRILFQFLQNLAVGWFIPLLGAAILLPMLQLVVFINHWIGGALGLLIFALFGWRTISQSQKTKGALPPF